MKETLERIAKALIPDRNTVRIFFVFVIMFFATLRNNPIESAVTALTPLRLHQYHSTVAPFTPVEDESFGTKKYCTEATGIIECASLYPKENIKNLSLWYIISAASSGLIARFGIGGIRQ